MHNARVCLQEMSEAYLEALTDLRYLLTANGFRVEPPPLIILDDARYMLLYEDTSTMSVLADENADLRWILLQILSPCG